MLSLTKFKEWLFPTPPPMNYTSWAEYNDFCNNYTKFCTLQDNKLKDCFALNLSNNTKLNEKVIGGLSWVDYFIGLTFVVAQRSKDSQTKHGCIITDSKNHIIGCGYNSFPHGMEDDTLPNTRPEKYHWMLHAEENAISNTLISTQTLDNVTAFISGQPCQHCSYLLWQNNIKKWYIAKRQGTKLEDSDTRARFDKFVEQTGVDITYVDVDLSWIKAIEV